MMLSLLMLMPLTTTVVVIPAADPQDVPERFRLKADAFPVTVELKHDLIHSGVRVYDVRFPSAVVSSHVENNTAYCELFIRHRAEPPLTPNPSPRRGERGAKPTVIVFDILDGQTVVSRGQAMWLAQHDINAMAFTMAYYGPRRPPGTKLRMLMPDLEHSQAAVTQTVLDARRAVQYLATRDDVDTKHLGVVGTSLGSFIGGLVAASEPKVTHATLLLGGGGLVDAFYDHPKAKSFKALNDALGIGKAGLKKFIDPLDPLTYAPQLQAKKLMLIAAKRDDVVPPAAMTRLWQATGEPMLLWLDSTHVGSAAFAFPVMKAVVEAIQK